MALILPTAAGQTGVASALASLTVEVLGGPFEGDHMFARGLWTAAVACLIAPAMPAPAAEAVSAWKIEPSDARCVAVRHYGSAEKPTILALKATLEGDAVQMAILRSGYRKTYAQTGADLEIGGQSFPTSALSYPIGGDRRRVTHLINLDSEASAALRSAETVKVTVREGVNDSFALAPSTEMWRSLQECVARLRQTWNASDERRIRILAPARGNLQALFSSEDYPLAMILAEKSGSARFALLIDESGKVRDCTVVKPSGVAVLDSRSCGIIIDRARFAPAVDMDGKPAKSFWVQTVTWQLH